MKKIADLISNNYIIILIIGLLLLIPTIYGYFNTRINYDILVYLPKTVDTIKGENILNDDFGLGSYAFVISDMKDTNKILNLESKIKKINGVDKVFSVADVIGTTIPKEMLPDEIINKLYKDDSSIIMVTFKDSTSSDLTLNAIDKLRLTVKNASKVSSMSSMVLDTKNLSDQEFLTYVTLAVVLCLIVLMLSTNSYLVPILLLGNIGIAIIYNLGTNIFLGEISYVTKAITAILQLGVTTDFSIFLYHKYIQEKEKETDKKKAMSTSIQKTFKSVLGSSLTTFAGFLALCTMQLTLGKDIGIVMAKGVLCGLLTVFTIFPAFLLIFDNQIEKTKHKIIFPKFKILQNFSLKHYKKILIVFIILLVPIIYGFKNYNVYYKLDNSLPKDLPFALANKELEEKFNITSPEIILLDKSIKSNEVNNLVDEIKSVKGINQIIAPNTLINKEIVDFLPKDLKQILDNKKYQILILNSEYEIASTEINNQIKDINKILKKYDKKAILAGEGPLMADLVKIADYDFKAVNYTSIAVIFIIMLFVLQSFALPIVLICAIEGAIMLNLACAYYTGVTLPFIASIVVGTIQLGATIDYAILMSNTYLEQRNKKEKEKAMKKTLELTIPSIITSALCFFAATIGVGLYTKIDMIGSICTLLARGSIISMLIVILVLPSLLLTFDKLILKTTRKREVK